MPILPRRQLETGRQNVAIELARTSRSKSGRKPPAQQQPRKQRFRHGFARRRMYTDPPGGASWWRTVPIAGRTLTWRLIGLRLRPGKSSSCRWFRKCNVLTEQLSCTARPPGPSEPACPAERPQEAWADTTAQLDGAVDNHMGRQPSWAINKGDNFQPSSLLCCGKKGALPIWREQSSASSRAHRRISCALSDGGHCESVPSIINTRAIRLQLQRWPRWWTRYACRSAHRW